MLPTIVKEHGEATATQRYWLHDYDANESIRQIKQCENRKFESKVQCGLELWRTKYNIGPSPGYCKPKITRKNSKCWMAL